MLANLTSVILLNLECLTDPDAIFLNPSDRAGADQIN